VDELLARPEFVDYWSYKWSDLLLVSSARLNPPAMWAYYNWIRDHVAANTPWDQFAREIVTATGSTLENGAANFFILHKDPTKLAENTSMAFLGVSIECAKCHNHPLEKWTNDQYFAFANLFSRVRQKNGDGLGNVLVYAAQEGELIQPRTGRAQPPRPLDGEPVPPHSDLDRRAILADWLVSPDNPYFSRAITNRVWANFFAVGLVENVDDLRQSNPASNEPLFAALAEYLVDHRYDLRELMKLILNSEAYQRSSLPLEQNQADQRAYARRYPARLMAEVMLDAISQVTESPTEFPGYPPGLRAIQLPDANVDSYFLTSFGRAPRNITCECERTEQPSVAQVLHLSNGNVINRKLATEDGRVARLIKEGKSNDEIVDEIFLAALCRFPTEHEKSSILPLLDEAQEDARRTAVEDLFWSVLTTKEFLFNH
jgi:hypothetical protein